MPTPKAGRSSYSNEPPRTKTTQALRNAREKDASLQEASMPANQTASENPAAGQQTGTARFFVARTGNGSTRETHPTAAVSNASSSSGTHDPVGLLLNQVTTLESRAASLATQLLEASGQLESGGIPTEGLASDLAVFHADVTAAQRQTADLARSLSVPSDAAMSPVATFRVLRTVLAAIRETQDRNAFRDLHAQAAHELESVLAIESGGGVEFAPLDESKGSAKRLLADIAGAEWPNSHPESLPLVQRRHPYSRLLDLVRDGDRLSDSDWETAQEAVATAFGKPLAVAAVRGRLHVRVGPAAAAAVEVASHCPSCKAELEPGAKFCGDCGFRID
jgi:hypothetical protein